MTAISVSERLLEMAAFYTPLALTVTLKWCLPFILPFTENLCDRIFRVLVDRGAQFLSDPDTACG